MHTDLYFQATDAKGVAQVWQLPRSGEPPRPLTTGSVSITSYAIAPDQSKVAYIVEDELIVADLDGARQRLVATLQPGRFPSSVDWSPDGTRLAFHDARGVWTVPADGFRPQHMLVSSHPPSENQADAANVKVYFDPRWSPDGTRLLVRIGFWEGSILGVIDAASGGVTELLRVVGSPGDWTADGRVIAWASSWGYASPGLFLLDPAQPDAEPVLVLESGTPVVDVARRAQGDWLVLVSSTAEIGPQYVHVLGAATLDGPFLPVAGNTAGGFVSAPQISAPAQGGAILAAGLGGMAYDEAGLASGNLVILNMSTGETVQIQTGGPVWDIQWGR
jgi:Tol biopolymer transport system component